MIVKMIKNLGNSMKAQIEKIQEMFNKDLEELKKKKTDGGRLQDGGRVRCGDHLPPHKYIRNTSTCGTAPTEQLLNAGRRPQISQKARNLPCTWVGQKKKEKPETKK